VGHRLHLLDSLRRPHALGTGDRRTSAITDALAQHGAATTAVEADLADPDTPARVFDEVERGLGNVTALVMCHCESVDSGLLDTTVESFDRHFAVNARATWLLIREYGRRFAAAPGSGRIIALTSDHTVNNLPTAPARAPWTGSPWPPHTNSPTSASQPTSSTRGRWTPVG
jgi:NAD(P)-dependent dehydrogenase (short-subunit alcohol dehydrogenase family)